MGPRDLAKATVEATFPHVFWIILAMLVSIVVLAPYLPSACVGHMRGGIQPRSAGGHRGSTRQQFPGPQPDF